MEYCSDERIFTTTYILNQKILNSEQKFGIINKGDNRENRKNKKTKEW